MVVRRTNYMAPQSIYSWFAALQKLMCHKAISNS